MHVKKARQTTKVYNIFLLPFGLWAPANNNTAYIKCCTACNSTHTGFHTGFFGGSGENDACRAMPPRGVQEHAPQGDFLRSSYIF